MKKLLVYTKRSPSHKFYWDLIIVRNLLNCKCFSYL